MGEIVSFLCKFRIFCHNSATMNAIRTINPQFLLLNPLRLYDLMIEMASWTDVVVQGNTKAKPTRRGCKRKFQQVVSRDNEKHLQLKPKK